MVEAIIAIGLLDNVQAIVQTKARRAITDQ